MIQVAPDSKVKFDRSFKPVKIPIHMEASYTEILKKCKEFLWPDQSEEQDDNTHSYYLSDGSGASIYAGGKFELVSPNDSKRKETLPWTLQNYLRVSKITYPSRARIYIVKIDGNSASAVIIMFANIHLLSPLI